jgi:hypothetical protein
MRQTFAARCRDIWDTTSFGTHLRPPGEIPFHGEPRHSTNSDIFAEDPFLSHRFCGSDPMKSAQVGLNGTIDSTKPFFDQQGIEENLLITG